MYLFGSGVLYGTPLTDAAGAAIANPTPVKFGTLQNVSVDISFENKMLYGQKQFPVAVGRGKGKVSGKASIGNLNGGLINSLFFGQTLTTGQIGISNGDVSATIPTTPFTITPTVPNSGTWVEDLGVIMGGVQLSRVASGPAAGQYSVSAGVYTFAAADTGKTVYISYRYTATVAGASKSVVTNQLMGYAPSFSCHLSAPYAGKQLTLILHNCISGKLSFATKQDDFIVPEFDFDAFADSNEQVLTFSLQD